MNHRFHLMISSLLLVSPYVFTNSGEIPSEEISQTREVIIIPSTDQIHRITDPGSYKLDADIYYTGNMSAIVITAHDVELDLGGKSIVLEDPSADGIRVKPSAWNFKIFNGYIRNKADFNLSQMSGNGIKVNANRGEIQDVLTHRHNIGLNIDPVQDLTVKNCIFHESNGAAAWIQGAGNSDNIGSTNIQFDECTFRDAVNGILVDGFNNKDLIVKNCQFPDASQTDLLVLSISGLVVDNCNFTNKNANSTENDYKRNMVQLGGTGENQWVNAVVFKNCTLINQVQDNPWIEGLNVRQGFNVLIDTCTFSLTNWVMGYDEEVFPSAIHLGNWIYETYAYNCVVRNCTIGGFSLSGINIDAGYGHIIEGNTISDMFAFGIYQWNSDGCTVRNNVITNIGYLEGSYWGDGIYVDNAEGDSQYNVYNNNTVNSCSRNGITILGTWNLFQHNQALFNNDIGIYNNTEGDGWNKFLFNVSYGNCTDYNNVYPLSLLGTTPTVPGENIYTSNNCD